MKIVKNIIPLLFISILVSCGGDNEVDNAENSEGTAGDEASNVVFADVMDLAKQSELNTIEFNRVVNFLEGEEVILTGYPYAYPLGIGTEIEFKPNSSGLIDGTDNSLKTCSIKVKFKDEQPFSKRKSTFYYSHKYCSHHWRIFVWL